MQFCIFEKEKKNYKNYWICFIKLSYKVLSFWELNQNSDIHLINFYAERSKSGLVMASMCVPVHSKGSWEVLKVHFFILQA